jgi:hypothetical protein
MAIQIRSHLAASPNPASLPRQIGFRQTLRSNIDGEAVVVAFQMAPDHEIWFEDASGNPTKTIQRNLQVSQVDQLVLTTIALIKGAGTGPMTMVEIDQTITDSSGVIIPDSCELEID